MLKYIKLFIYSCIFCVLANLIMGVGGAALIYIYKGHFYYPFHQVIRAISFGVIAGSAITLAAISFKLIDTFKIKNVKYTPFLFGWDPSNLPNAHTYSLDNWILVIPPAI
jgi:hypothetical protein